MKFIIFAVFSLNLFAYGLPVCKRTQQVQDEIVRKFKQKLDPSITCEHVDQLLDYIQFLNLEYKGITSLKAGDFSGLYFLRLLFMNNNNLSALPAGVFSELYSLRGLDLEHNKFSALPSGVFSGLPSFKRFTLWGNPLPQAEKDRIKKELPHVDIRFY